MSKTIHCKKRLAVLPSLARMSLTELSQEGNNYIIKLTKLSPARNSLVSDIPAGDGKTANLFLQCVVIDTGWSHLSKDLH